jgi:hypothetical protein
MAKYRGISDGLNDACFEAACILQDGGWDMSEIPDRLDSIFWTFDEKLREKRIRDTVASLERRTRG